MLAHGFSTDMMAELVNAGLATATSERVVRHWHSGCCRSGGPGRFVRRVTDMPAVLVNGTWFADMLGHDLAGAVEAALVDLGLERRHTSGDRCSRW